MSIENIVIRNMTEADIDQVAELVVRLKGLNEELDPHFKVVPNIYDVVKEYLARSLKDENTVVLVAEDTSNKVIAGIIRFVIEDRLFYEPRLKAQITDFYIRPQYRRKSLGKMLIDKTFEEARKRGAGIVTAIYPAGNSIADSFYTRLGFTELNKELYKPCSI
ncbi:Putative acetyltransferase [Acidilobus saccharovorans 345-15]|uniref:Putative acetyltransferase n=1 Tax=Acidilobus saccharovorans (strain DSM 16705 / JCM 18335 / VKM B-2471 / 345-15) TaxID=666510 RepID=D9Q0T3_ACIS3|nr:GNAT family N-acetyltransferase [Acidilobus saccharovorans]ADL18921.1 Putative acetyltransferase [Acidilobus saccharovorans 345-15]